MAIDLNWKYITAIVIQSAIIGYFINQSIKARAARKAAPAAGSYEGMRQLAVSITPQQLKLEIPPSHILVYGVVMDWDMGEDMVTLLTYITGAANMYFRSGEGVIGGGKNKEAGEAAIELVIAARDYLERAVPVTTAEFPLKGCIRFHFLTNQRMFAAQENWKFISDGSSPWLPLFEKASNVMTILRDQRAI